MNRRSTRRIGAALIAVASADSTDCTLTLSQQIEIPAAEDRGEHP